MLLEPIGSDLPLDSSGLFFDTPKPPTRLRLPSEDLGVQNLSDWQGQQLARQLMRARHSKSAKN
jgi:hypothetical protein